MGFRKNMLRVYDKAIFIPSFLLMITRVVKNRRRPMTRFSCRICDKSNILSNGRNIGI